MDALRRLELLLQSSVSPEDKLKRKQKEVERLKEELNSLRIQHASMYVAYRVAMCSHIVSVERATNSAPCSPASHYLPENHTIPELNLGSPDEADSNQGDLTEKIRFKQYFSSL